MLSFWAERIPQAGFQDAICDTENSISYIYLQNFKLLINAQKLHVLMGAFFQQISSSVASVGCSCCPHLTGCFNVWTHSQKPAKLVIYYFTERQGMTLVWELTVTQMG